MISILLLFGVTDIKSFTGAPVMCAQYLLQASHPPGFYRTSRNNVWIDLDKEYNRIPEKVQILNMLLRKSNMWIY